MAKWTVAEAKSDAVSKRMLLEHLQSNAEDAWLDQRKLVGQLTAVLQRVTKEALVQAYEELSSGSFGPELMKVSLPAKPSDAAFRRLFGNGPASSRVGGSLEEALKSDRLDWYRKRLDDEDATVVAYVISESAVLTNLNLGFRLDKISDNNQISDEGAAAIAEALRGNTVLRKLNLQNNKIGAAGATAMVSALQVNGVLTELNLDGRELDLPKLRGTDPVESLELTGERLKRLGPASAIVIASLIAGNEVLTSLDLSSNGLTEEAALGIVRVERQRNKLTSLGLASCGIGPAGAAEIAEYVSGSAVLKNLDLGENDIGGKGAVAIADALRVNGVLTNLRLYRSNIGDEGAKAIGGALAVNGVLKTLNLRRNNIGDEGATAIGEALRGNEVLKTLDIGDNKIGPKGITAIADALDSVLLTTLGLDSNDIGPEGGVAIGKGLKANASLTDLNLGVANIGPEGAKAISWALQGNTALTKLHLKRNELGPNGGAAVADAIKGHPSLTYLNLCCNNIGDANNKGADKSGVKALTSAFRANAVLNRVDLTLNSLGWKAKRTLRNAKRSSLQWLELDVGGDEELFFLP